jgi:hypothetical protein
LLWNLDRGKALIAPRFACRSATTPPKEISLNLIAPRRGSALVFGASDEKGILRYPRAIDQHPQFRCDVN